MPVKAAFVATPLSGSAPLLVNFISSSTGVISSYLWTFGDGGTNTEQNPGYTYNEPGTYSVKLSVAGPSGSSETAKNNYVTITASPLLADFSAQPRSGSAPLTVAFTDTSTGEIDVRKWDFGDSELSPEKNPVHQYQQSGTYNVSLTIIGPGGSDTKLKQFYIAVDSNIPSTDFTAAPVSGAAPLSVTFTDISKGTIVSWYWNFGDAGTSLEQNPTHIYTSPGAYNVSLTAAGASGQDSEIKQGMITVLPQTASVTYSLSGRVTGVPDNNVSIFLFGEAERAVQTDSSGIYTFEGLSPGTYTVIPVKGQTAFAPASRIVKVESRNVSAVNFAWEQPGIAISGEASSRDTIADDAADEAVLFVKTTVARGSSVHSVVIDLSPLGGRKDQPMSDNGKNGDAVAGDGIYAVTATAARGTAPGAKILRITATDSKGKNAEGFVTLKVINLINDTVNTVKDTSINNKIEGQTLIIRFSLTGTARSARMQAKDACSTLLDILMPDNTAYRENIPVADAESEFEVKDAMAGEWVLRIRNLCPEPKQFSIATTTSGTGILSGAVVNGATGKPLESIPLKSDSGANTVAVDGYYLMMLPAGIFTIAAASPDYLPASHSALIQAGGAEVLDFALMPLGSVSTTTSIDVFKVNFLAFPVIGPPPLTVLFSNTSTGEIESYDWNFGDGSTSAEKDPLHTYAALGTYSVVLRATTPEGVKNSEGKIDYIRVVQRICALDAAIDDPGHIKTLRKLRDMLEEKSPALQRIPFLYYRHTEEVVRILADNSRLMYLLKKILEDNIEAGEKIAARQQAKVSGKNLSAIISFLVDLSGQAGPALKSDLYVLIKTVQEPCVMEELGILSDEETGSEN